MLTDDQLIARCRRGDGRAWDTVVAQYERLIFSIALNNGCNNDDAADVTQITFTIFMQSLDRFGEDTNLKGWLGTVAKRHSWRYAKKRQREQPQEEADLSEMEVVGAAHNPFTKWEQLEWVTQGFAKLGERCRQLLEALYFDEREPAYSEVADKLGMKVGSIGPTRARCLEKMRKHLT